MNFYRGILLLCVLLASGYSEAQHFRYSHEPDSFVVDVVRNLKAIRLEATEKVAYDFQNAWSSQIPDDQKASIIAICDKMAKRRLPTQPYYRYFFSLITYAITQENASTEELNNIIKIVDHAVEHYDKKELSSFYKTLTFFFARGYIYHSHYNKLTSTEGSYKIELLDEVEPIKTHFEEILEEEEEEDIPFVPIDAEKEIREVDEYVTSEEVTDDWGGDDWADDDWSSADDDWGTDDDWGSDDSWDTGGGWVDTDGWGSSDDSGILPDPEELEEEKEEVYVRPVYEYEKPDLVAAYQADDIDPPIGGAVIQIEGMDLKMATPYDTIHIKNAKGTLLLKDQIFVGTGGEFDWPDRFRGTEGAVVYLKNYSFDTRSAELKTSRAKMVFPKMFEDSVAGAFHFKSGLRKRGRKWQYPKFISLHSDIELNLPGDSLKYVGGFGMHTDQMFGESISQHPGVLEVYGKDDRSFKSKAIRYEFQDSLVKSAKSEFMLYHGGDSIYHPAVQMKYDAAIPKLTLIKDKGDYKNTYYYSSFFKMEFKSDLLEWNLYSDSLDVSIMNAPNMIPAVFESEEYFNPIRYEKMSGLFGFHPIMTVVRYARKVQDSHFNILELVGAYHMDEQRIHSAVLFLNQNGYITYDEESGDIQVLRKAFHNVMSYSKKKDYDNFLVSSISPGSPNATLHFDTKEMDVRGVKKVYITPDQEVFFEPEEKVLTLLEDKSMKFNGLVNAEDFQYKGHDFIFNYNEYIVQMDAIDSIRIQIAFDEGNEKRTTLHQHLEATSGTLYINDPKNKAGLKNYVQYPYFVSESEAIVFFDSPDILDGAYDKSIYFVVPPFKSDTVGQGDPLTLGFEGTFYSGNIMPPFKETLKIMPDKSLGFKHEAPDEGYNLYEGGGVFYDSVYMDFGGLQGNGRIDYRTAEVNSERFIFYMDSVTAEGVEGLMNEGTIGEATYPEAVLADFRMLWLPLKDSMYIENRKAPFQFYNSTASLEGKANITAKGVFGSGVMLSRGSRSTSQDFHFEIDKYSGRHSEFEILTDNPDKPAMQGEDIYFRFDLAEDIAEIRPEVAGVASISFPYSQMKTSITEAIWYLDSAKIAMNKPEEVDISYSYFYTTREDLDSLAFNATGALYDMDDYELHIFGIPYIRVADAEIIPESHETTILENSVLQPFDNVKLKIDTLNGYHNLYDGYITVISRKKFEGHATYQLVNSELDTFAIEFASFDLQAVPNVGGGVDSMTVSGGFILESQNVKTSPGFFFKGDVTMYANQRNLHKEGFITPDFQTLGRYDYWISYDSKGDSSDVYIDLAQSKTETEQPVEAGILVDNLTGDLYMSFVQDKNKPDDYYFFKAEGFLFYDHEKKEFRIEEQSKTMANSYAGKSFSYDDKNWSLLFEGPVDFIRNKSEYGLRSTVLGYGVPDSSVYSLDAMLLMDMELHPTLIASMQSDIHETVEIIGHEPAHKNRLEVMLKLAEFIGDAETKKYENGILTDYQPLVKLSPELETTLGLTQIDLKWSKRHRTWYSTSKIGLSHIVDRDINAQCDGFMEILTTDEGDDQVHLFLQVSPSTWYFFSYEQGRLLLYSSNPDFNNLVAEHTTVEKTGFGEYTTLLGDEFEVLDYVDRFRLQYFGITDEYDLSFPDDTHLTEDEAVEPFYEEEEEEEEPVEPVNPVIEDEDDGF